MYGGSKDSGNIIGAVSGSDTQSIEEVLDSAGCEETIVCEGPLMLRSYIDTNNGTLAWTQVPDEQIKAMENQVLTSNQIGSMLHDSDRNSVYKRGIEKLLDNFQIHVKDRSPLILDIGAGTGLLSMLAVNHTSKESSCFACEMYEPLSRVAEEVITDNGFAENIQMLPMKSIDLEMEDDGPKFDIVLSELLDSALLGESCILSHADALRRLVSKNVIPSHQKVLPHSAELWGCLIESEEVDALHFVDNKNFMFGHEGRGGTPWRDAAAADCRGGWPLLPLHYSTFKERNEPQGRCRELSEEVKLMSFEFFHGAEKEIDQTCTEYFEGLMEMKCGGKVSGLLLYWKLFLLDQELDPDREVMYCTKADAQNYQDHWVQVVYPFPSIINGSMNDRIHLQAFHDNIQIWFRAFRVEVSEEQAQKRSRHEGISENGFQRKTIDGRESDTVDKALCQCGWHLVHSAERIAMLNDSERTNTWETSLYYTMNTLLHPDRASSLNVKNGLILDLGDGSILGITMAHIMMNYGLQRHDCKVRIASREAKFMSRMFYNQMIAANGVGRVISCWDGVDLAFLNELFDDDGSATGSATRDDRDEEKGEEDAERGGESGEVKELQFQLVALVTDCYQYQLQSRPVWQALSFAYQRTALDFLLHPSVIITPARAHIKVAVLQLDDLHISHKSCDSITVEGLSLDHSAFERKRQDREKYWLPYKLADYRKQFLSEVKTIKTLDYYTKMNPAHFSEEIILDFVKEGRCDCIAIWVDYDLDDGDKYKLTSLSEAQEFPSYLKVNICLLKAQKDITAMELRGQESAVRARARFSVGECDVDLSCEFV